MNRNKSAQSTFDHRDDLLARLGDLQESRTNMTIKYTSLEKQAARLMSEAAAAKAKAAKLEIECDHAALRVAIIEKTLAVKACKDVEDGYVAKMAAIEDVATAGNVADEAITAAAIAGVHGNAHTADTFLSAMSAVEATHIARKTAIGATRAAAIGKVKQEVALVEERYRVKCSEKREARERVTQMHTDIIKTIGRRRRPTATPMEICK